MEGRSKSEKNHIYGLEANSCRNRLQIFPLYSQGGQFPSACLTVQLGVQHCLVAVTEKVLKVELCTVYHLQSRSHRLRNLRHLPHPRLQS